MPGMFYRSSSPDEPPFVQVGDSVSKNDTICLIEAMKIFNEVQSESDCDIIEILVENATAVEFDQPLFRIKRS
jgi:acetyl-CoA carboxylase biotin carboxyl carrier protein